MKTALVGVACLALAVGLHAQTPTTIGPHHMGETFDEWLTINSLNLTNICQKHHQDKQMDYKTVCKTLSGIRDTGSGVFTIVMGDISSQPFSWRFVDGKAAQVTSRLDIDELVQQVQFLNGKYGDSTFHKNVYGDLTYLWSMPDSTTITLETLNGHFTVTFVLTKFARRLAEDTCRNVAKEKSPLPQSYERCMEYLAQTNKPNPY